MENPQTMNRREALKRVAVLMGGALSAPTVAGVLGGCQGGVGTDWNPVVLLEDSLELVRGIAERIIPETDTPGAVGAGVDRFIDRMLAEWYPEDYRQEFLDGLADVNRRAQEAGGADFLDLDGDQQDEILAAIDRENFESPPKPVVEEPVDELEAAGGYDVLSPEMRGQAVRTSQRARERIEARRPDGGPIISANADHEGRILGDPSFWPLMKELTVVGYYTSEVGASEELMYVRVPGRWDACIDFGEVGRAWA
jgi:hypothetical protein